MSNNLCLTFCRFIKVYCNARYLIQLSRQVDTDRFLETNDIKLLIRKNRWFQIYLYCSFYVILNLIKIRCLFYVLLLLRYSTWCWWRFTWLKSTELLCASLCSEWGEYLDVGCFQVILRKVWPSTIRYIFFKSRKRVGTLM
jgi:hypothetical protein